MRKKLLTTYLTISILSCLITVFLLIGLFSPKAWWNSWMAMIPIIYMIIMAFYCNLMIKNCEASHLKATWLLAYKGIKIGITIAMVVLYYLFVNVGIKAFLLITMVSYLIALIVETWAHTHFIKHMSEKGKKK